jgi:chorismate-pyruvate lyase
MSPNIKAIELMKPRNPRRRSIGSALPTSIEERWFGEWQLPRDLSPALRSWLLEPGLLTDRILNAAGCKPTLRVLSLHWGVLSAAQCARLHVEGARCFVREIELVTQAKRWVFAQTLVPESEGILHTWLAALGSRSLGEALESAQSVTRGPLEFCYLSPSHPLVVRALEGQAPNRRSLWARRRWIALIGQRLLVQEVFLPDHE